MKKQGYGRDKIERDARHYYYTPVGKLPSVTMITGVIDDGKSGALIGWAVRETCNYIEKSMPEGGLIGYPTLKEVLDKARKEAVRQKEEAANVGKIVHDIIEMKVKEMIGVESGAHPLVNTEIAVQVERACKAWERFCRKTKFHPEYSEMMVYSRAVKYGGTLDIVATGKFPRQHKTRRYLIDIKTGTVLPLSHGAQLSAYAMAWEEMHGEKIEGIAVLQLDKATGLPVWHDFSKNRAKRWKTFKAARALWETINAPDGRGRR